ncbi:MAG: MFS transporter [Ilumatobacteraceae bacterium]
MPTINKLFVRADKFPGWWVVGACFVLLSMSSGVGFYGLAVYLNAFSNEFGWTVSSISLATTFFFLVSGLSGLWIAKFIATRDVRIMILGGAVLGAVALYLLGFVDQRWQLFAVYTMYALGWSAAGFGPATTVVTRWFHAKRASALAIASTGLSVGGIVITPLIKWIIDERGIRGGSPWLALMWLVGVVPVTVLFLRPHPQPYGWLPDGERVVAGETSLVAGVPLHEAVKSRFFRCISIGYIFAMGAQVGAIQQLVKLVNERAGKGTATAATIVLSSMSIFGRFAGGRLIPKTSMIRFTIGVAGVQAVGLATLSFMESPLPILLSIGLFGISTGNILMMQSLLIADRFGVLDFPRISARVGLIAFSGTAGGPLLLGWLHDAAGGYRTSYLVASMCSLIAVLIFSFAATDSTSFDATSESRL